MIALDDILRQRGTQRGLVALVPEIVDVTGLALAEMFIGLLSLSIS